MDLKRKLTLLCATGIRPVALRWRGREVNRIYARPLSRGDTRVMDIVGYRRISCVNRSTLRKRETERVISAGAFR